MSTVQALEPGSRYDLRAGISPDAPDEDNFKDEKGAFGYCHSYETSSRYDGPGLRSSSSSPAACCAARTATIRIRGI